MTKRDALSIALKVIGVVWAAEGVLYAIAGVPQALTSPDGLGLGRGLFIAQQTGTALVFLMVAGVLLHYTDRLTAVLVPNDSELRLLPLDGPIAPLLQVTIRILGVALAAVALSQIPSRTFSAAAIARLREASAHGPYGPESVVPGSPWGGPWGGPTGPYWLPLLEPASGLIIGVLLVLAAGMLARFLARGGALPDRAEAQP